jgi:DNA modification methylase
MNPADRIERRAIEELIPYARNSRTHSDAQVAQIAASIKEWGWTMPILVDEQGGIIAGHGRVLAARSLGHKDVPVVIASGWSDAKKRAYVIADNKLALNAGWDDEMLKLELKDLQAMDYEMDLIGFSAEDLEAMLNESETTEGLTDEDAVPDAPEEPKTKPGDIYQLGRHRLMCGDSTSIDAVEKLMDGCIAEICFTSPPYADQREYNGDKELSTQHIATFIRSAYGKVNYFVVNLGYSRKDQEVNSYWEDYIQEAKDCGLKLLSWNIWDRSGFGYTVGQATAMFTIDHEWIFVFGNKAKSLNKTVENKQSGVAKKGTIRQKNGETTAVFTETHSHRQMGTIIRCDVARYKGGDHTHPAMFPVELAETYIESMTSNKDIVYEPFCGSGTTMIACEKLGRTNFSMELDPKYCDVIVKRWEDFTGKKAELLTEAT